MGADPSGYGWVSLRRAQAVNYLRVCRTSPPQPDGGVKPYSSNLSQLRIS